MLRVDPRDADLMARWMEMFKHAMSVNLLDQLIGQLQYLGRYGYDREQPLKVSRCTLAQDFAPLSLRFVMEKGEILSPTETRWEFWFNGGLIYQGPEQAADGSFPVLTVSLSDGQGWFVHT